MLFCQSRAPLYLRTSLVVNCEWSSLVLHPRCHSTGEIRVTSKAVQASWRKNTARGKF